jgi:hypothetical protein
MLTLFIPIIFIVVIAALALGLSFLCIEVVVRMIGRGLSDTTIDQPQPARNFTKPMFDRTEVVEQRNTGGLRVIPVQ